MKSRDGGRHPVRPESEVLEPAAGVGIPVSFDVDKEVWAPLN